MHYRPSLQHIAILWDWGVIAVSLYCHCCYIKAYSPECILIVNLLNLYVLVNLQLYTIELSLTALLQL